MIKGFAFNNPFEVSDQVSLQALDWPILDELGIEAWIHRDDEISPHINGNKYYKLFYNLRNALQQNCKTLVSFGGPYSNHIHALAAAGHQLGLNTVGLIRGRQNFLSPCLQDAKRWNMDLRFLSKRDFRRKDISSIFADLKSLYGQCFLIPEGGENLAGVRGCGILAQAVEKKMAGRGAYTLCVATGTGATLAGLVQGSRHPCLGVSVLKGDDTISSKVKRWLQLLGSSRESWRLTTDYHHGGYAKVNADLLHFMRRFERRNHLMLDPVYTVKLVWAIECLAKSHYWPEGSRLVLHHSGGLQGRRGFDLQEGGEEPCRTPVARKNDHYQKNKSGVLCRQN